MANENCAVKPTQPPNYLSSGTRNLLKMVSDHKYGSLKSSSFESQVTKLKVCQLKHSVEEFEIDSDISFCKFLKASDAGSMIGVWQRNMDPASKHSSIYHLKFVYNDQYYDCDEYESCPIITDLSCSGPFFKRMDVTDSCEQTIQNKRLLLYVGNTVVSGGRIVLSVLDDSWDNSGLSEIVWHSHKNIWSCASNAFTENFVAGTEKGCYVFDMINFTEIENLHGDVLAVEFSKNGSIFYCGMDKNELAMFDLRENAWHSIHGQLYKRQGLNGVKEIKLLSDETTIIICAVDGKLWMMDVRMKRPVFQYYGSINKIDRRPISADEGLDLLCATGDDNCSRIWSLRSGELLKTLHPSHQRTSSHACLVAEQRRWFVAVVQDNILTPVFHY